MGVEWYVCEICKRTFSDLSDYVVCTSCGSKLCEDCGDSMLYKHGGIPAGEDEDGSYRGGASDRCKSCDPRTVTDAALVEFLLGVLSWSKDEVIDRIRGQRGV